MENKLKLWFYYKRKMVMMSIQNTKMNKKT